MLLRAAALAVAALVATAPIQCGHTPESELREDETPGDALWALAQKFHDEHDVAAERQTLEYLVERYPASRWAAAAREELAKGAGTGGGAGAGANAGAGDGGG